MLKIRIKPKQKLASYYSNFLKLNPMKKTLLFSLLLLSFVANSQTKLPYFSQNGLMEKVFDGYGNFLSWDVVSMANGKRLGGGSISSITTCTAGRFVFDAASIFSVTAIQNVMCELGNNLSGFIASPSSSPAPINIFCTYGTGATAFPYYVYSTSPPNPNQGYLRSQVEKTLISGVDAYSNLPISSFSTTNTFSTNTFYHGRIEVSGILPWNTTMSTTTIASNEYDFYSIMLHEMMHMVGLFSLINVNGYSKIGSTCNYFTYYDQFLCDKNGNPLLSKSLCNPTITYTAALAAINPSLCINTSSTAPVSNISICSTAVIYSSPNTTATVYTPDCWENNGGPLQHLEDMCSGTYTGTCVATPSVPGHNDLYFASSNFAQPGTCYVKRFMTPEEKGILCDLGYSVAATYTSNAVLRVASNSNSVSVAYTPCNPTNVVGLNDGLINSVFIYTTVLSATTIPYSVLLANDSPSTQVTCLDLVAGPGTLLPPGTSDFTITAPQGSGLQILRYLPQNTGNMQYGNITFVYVYFDSYSCTPSSSCNIIENGGFENQSTTNCGNITPNNGLPFSVINCWAPNTCGPENPALFKANCTSSSSTVFNLAVNTLDLTPPVSSHNGTVNNTSIIGLKAYQESIGHQYSYSIKNQLATPLTPGQSYQISLWFMNHSTSTSNSITTGTLNPNNLPCVITVASNTVWSFVPNATFPTSLTPLISFTSVATNTWTQYTGTFIVPTGSINQVALVLGIDNFLSQSISTLNQDEYFYGFLDDIVITPMPTPVFNPPSLPICGDSPIDLQQYASVTGTFTGASNTASSCITYTNGSYYFNHTPTLTTGFYPIAFTYSISNGCTYNLTQNINYQNSCCTASSIPVFTNSSVSTITTYVGPMRIANDFTIQSGGSLFLTGEFIMGNGTNTIQITVASGGSLYISGAHLYTCNNDLWKGISAKSGSVVWMVPSSDRDNLVEDAVTALDIQTSTLTTFPFEIRNTIFNKNYIDINIASQPNVTVSPFIENTVFTCRNFSFTSSSWPSVSTSSNGLRYSASTAVLSAPYSLQGASIVNLKNPYNNQKSHLAIQIANIGTLTTTYTAGYTYPLAFYGIDLSSTTTDTDFNLYDAHETYISSTDCNFTLSNSVFQNTQTFSVSGTQTVSSAIVSNNSSTTTCVADLSAPSSSIGNRFYDCHKGISIAHLINFKIDNATFRSTQSSTSIGSNTFQSTGQSGIFIKTNQAYDYEINNNEFTNLRDGVTLSIYPQPSHIYGFPYPMPYDFYPSASYVNKISINSNTLSPNLNAAFTGTGTNYMFNAITVNGPTSHDIYVTCGCNSVSINNNKIVGSFNGISLDGINSMTMSCRNSGIGKGIANNTISLAEDNLLNTTQVGINFSRSTSYPTIHGQRVQTIENNTINVFTGSAAISNTQITLMHLFNNGAITGTNGVVYPTPHVLCNDLSNAYNGFVFEGPNKPTNWKGNAMQDLGRGICLQNSGVIGQQGNSNNPCDNKWNNWGSSDATNVDLPSNANNSPLYLRSNSAPWFPPSNSGAAPIGNLYSTNNNNLPISASGTYSCGINSYTFENSALPNSTLIPNTELLYIGNTFAFRFLDTNDSLTSSSADLQDYYSFYNTTTIGQFNQIEKAINSGDFSTATSILTLLDQSLFNQVETNYYTFFSIYKKYMIGDDPLSEDDINNLISLSGLCPGTNGEPTYQAKALYQLTTGKVYNGSNTCADYGAKHGAVSEIQEKQIEKLSKIWDVDLFPNPNNGNFIVLSKTEKENLEITVNDLSGKKLFKKQIQTNKFICILEINLLNGLYFVNIKNENNETVTKKMGIVK